MWNVRCAKRLNILFDQQQKTNQETIKFIANQMVSARTCGNQIPMC